MAERLGSWHEGGLVDWQDAYEEIVEKHSLHKRSQLRTAVTMRQEANGPQPRKETKKQAPVNKGPRYLEKDDWQDDASEEIDPFDEGILMLDK